MRQRLQGLVAGVVIGAMLTSGVVFAQDISKTIDVAYKNIKIFIDGAEYVAKDSNGNVIEPFVYNGTTYLPVRGIANAFGKDVVWDAASASIYLGKKDKNQPDNYLNRIQYSDYLPGNDESRIYNIKGAVTDYMGNDYHNGYLFSGRVFATQTVDIPVNMQYTTLKGKFSAIEKAEIVGKNGEADNYSDRRLYAEIYADDVLVHKTPLSSKSETFAFELNIKNAAKLTIKIRPEREGNLRSSDAWVALTDLALYK